MQAVGNFLEWMMTPISLAIEKLMQGLGIELPGLPDMPTLDLNIPNFY